MSDRKTLDLAREWAEWAEDNPSVPVGHIRDLPRAAAEVIRALPDSWVDADKLRDVVADHHIDMTDELMEALGALLPTPPAPPTMAEIKWDDEEHTGLVAKHYAGGYVRMVTTDYDDEDIIVCIDQGKGAGLHRANLTPVPGTKIDLTPTSPIEDKTAPEPASPRPDGCCGACPETVGGGVDCTCADNPRCPNHQPRPRDVPVGEPWQVEVDGDTAIGYRNDPGNPLPWCVTYQGHSPTDWLYDTDVTLIARLVPETTEQNEETESYPAYTYLDKDGDEWEYIDGGWFTADTHAKRAAKRKHHSGRASLPAKYGPYTRIKKENDHDQ